MKISNQNNGLLNIHLHGHIIIPLNLLQRGLDLKVNQPHDFLENVLVDEVIWELDDACVVGQEFADLAFDLVVGLVVLGVED
jgi:hypothetical protein